MPWSIPLMLASRSSLCECAQGSRKPPNAIHSFIPCSRATATASVTLVVARTGFPNVTSNKAWTTRTQAMVAMWPPRTARTTISSASRRARSTSPSGHSTQARNEFAVTATSWPKWKASSRSRSGSNMASARSRSARASPKLPANQWVSPLRRWAMPASGEFGRFRQSRSMICAISRIGIKSARTKLPAHCP